MFRNSGVLAVGCAVLTGCFFYASATNKQQNGTPDIRGRATHPPQKTVNQLQAGKTTKAEVLKRFGPPLSIATRGGTVIIDHGAQYPIGGMLAVDASYERVKADTFFELFATKHTITYRDRIYYCQYAVS